MGNQIKLRTNIKASQSLPFIEKILKMDGLRSYLTRDFNMALAKFRLILLICEQNGLQYWVNRDFRIANLIYDRSLDFRMTPAGYEMSNFKN